MDDLPPSPPPLPVRPPSDLNEDEASNSLAQEDGGWSRGSSPLLPPPSMSPQAGDGDPDAAFGLERPKSPPLQPGEGSGGLTLSQLVA